MRHVLFALALAATSVAAAPSYDYIDVGAMSFDFQQPSVPPLGPAEDEGAGLRFRSSVALDDEWFWTFEAAMIKFDVERGNQWKTGFGYAFPLDSFDIAVKLEIGRIDFGPSGGGGFNVDVQMRSAVWDHFELNAHVGETNVEPADAFLRYGAGMVWTPGDSVGVTLEYDIMTGTVIEAQSLAVGLRWGF